MSGDAAGFIGAISGALVFLGFYTWFAVKATSDWPRKRPQHRAFARSSLLLSVFGFVMVGMYAARFLGITS